MINYLILTFSILLITWHVKNTIKTAIGEALEEKERNERKYLKYGLDPYEDTEVTWWFKYISYAAYPIIAIILFLLLEI